MTCFWVFYAGLVATGSEDNSAKLWRADGRCLATLPHPGCVWACHFLPCGDLVTACADVRPALPCPALPGLSTRK